MRKRSTQAPLLGLQMAVLVFTWHSPRLQVSLQISAFCKDTGHIRSGIKNSHTLRHWESGLRCRNLAQHDSIHNTPPPPASAPKVTFMRKKQVFRIERQNQQRRTEALKTTPRSWRKPGSSRSGDWERPAFFQEDQRDAADRARRKANRKGKKSTVREKLQTERLSVCPLSPSVQFCSGKRRPECHGLEAQAP